MRYKPKRKVGYFYKKLAELGNNVKKKKKKNERFPHTPFKDKKRKKRKDDDYPIRVREFLKSYLSLYLLTQKQTAAICQIISYQLFFSPHPYPSPSSSSFSCFPCILAPVSRRAADK